VRPADRPLLFGAPVIEEAEIQSVVECLRSRWIGAGPRVEAFERSFAAYKRAPDSIAVSSGTAALHLALVGLGIGVGDEVLVPTMTFCSTVHAVLHSGARPVLVDCDRNTFNVSPSEVERLLTDRTRAMIVVHMCGRPCDMEPLLEISRLHGLAVIEDCAHAIESKWRGVPSGLLGDIGCFSFYATKNLTTADGGMVITKDASISERIRRLASHGMTANAWRRLKLAGCVGYEVVDAGFKYNMTDIAAALGLVQLEKLEERWQRRKSLWRRYLANLAELPLQLPLQPEPSTRHAYHLMTPLVDLGRLRVPRDSILEALKAENIGAGIHYVPVHSQPYYRDTFATRDEDFVNASDIGRRTLSLPLTADMEFEDVDDVATALSRILRFYSA
jgi:dTDP-4-amino-4,6-dideoxygalactose transaminase